MNTFCRKIERQSGLRFNYTGAFPSTDRVTASYDQRPLREVLEGVFAPRGIEWIISGKNILVKKSVTPAQSAPVPGGKTASDDGDELTVSGKVTNESGEAIVGATIQVKGTAKGVQSNSDGTFTIEGINKQSVLLVTSIGYEPVELPIKGKTSILARLRVLVSKLDETLVVAYGSTTKRFNTGSVGKVTSDEISKQPVSNPLSALQGRIAGVDVLQNSGIPGSGVKLTVRGQNSLLNGSEPLYIIDGVPFAAAGQLINQFGSVLSSLGSTNATNNGMSPFATLNPADIESVEVLKDADATSIYGSRGANGVVLITTKRARAGKPKFNANVYSGVSTVGRLVEKMNTAQYLKLRRDAFANDGVAPTNSNAYDLLVWDTTRSTDWDKLLYGGQANVIDAYTSFSAGNQNTQFFLGTGLRKENTVFGGASRDRKMSFKANLSHQLPDQKLQVTVALAFNSDDNILPQSIVATLPPNAPALYDSTGNLYWGPPGGAFDNPLAVQRRETQIKTNNWQADLKLRYNILKGLSFSTNIGYNAFSTNERSVIPIASLNPNTTATPLGQSRFGNVDLKSVIVEPQIEYTSNILGGRLSLLAGGTWQRNENYSSYIVATGYTNDLLLHSLDAGPTVADKDNQHSIYKYAAAFGRINYNVQNKYLLNLSARRDGSSRFGSNRRFANFGAVGAAWIFTEEKFMKKSLPFLSFGKLRGSYGTTGNDQIGDYRYLDTWSTVDPYQGGISLRPDALYNSDFSWERSKKLELALELGAWHDRVLLTVAYYRNRIDNQLTQFTLPSQTGFSGILRNFPAEFQNTGIEVTAGIDIIKSASFQWTVNGNMTFPKNKLTSFPGLENTSYVSRYIVGESINILRGYQSLGVDPQTGLYTFLDIDKDGALTSANDYVIVGTKDPKYFGGFRSVLKYKGFELDFFLEGKKQLGSSHLSSIYTIPNTQTPGYIINTSIAAANYWTTPGQKTDIQKVTVSSASAAYKLLGTIRASDAMYTDASYIKLRNISLSYAISNLLPKIFKDDRSCKIYVNAQNLFTITRYKYSDPEIQNLRGIPPLRAVTAGILVNL